MSVGDWVTESQQRYQEQPATTATLESARSFLDGALTRLQWAIHGRRSPVYTTRLAGERVHYFVENPKELRRARTALDEQRVLEWLMEPVCEETVVWDVGAYHGTYAVVAAAKGAPVVSFEPHPENAQRLAKNAVLNDAAIDQYDVALSSEATTKAFASGQTPNSQLQITASGEETVETVRGDAMHPQPDVVKIDVEGHEADVLAGMQETLAGVQRILVEVHEGVPTERIRQQLAAADLQVVGLETPRSQTYLGGVRG